MCDSTTTKTGHVIPGFDIVLRIIFVELEMLGEGIVMNNLDIFRFSITKTSQIYVTDQALAYFDLIENEMDRIAEDIYKAKTGKELGLFTPIDMEISDKIKEYRKCMRQCNKNNPNDAVTVIGLKDVLVKFKHIKALILKGNDALREDGVILFTKAASSYSEEEQEEFVNLLNENELRYIMQIACQERTIIDKIVTNSKMFLLVKEKMIQQENGVKKENDNEMDR